MKQPNFDHIAHHCASPQIPSPSADRPNFDHIARPYRWLEYLTLGKTLEHRRFHFLPQLLDRHHALVLGDGDGRFTAKLLATNQTIKVTAVDTSAAMLALLRRRCEAANTATRLQTRQTSALDFPLEGPYDLVVTHFFLDCLTQPDLEALITRTTPTLAPGAIWLISDFRIPPGRMRLAARAYIRTLYLAFRILTGLRTKQLPDHATALAKSGLTHKAHHQSLAGILTAELWQTPNKKT